MLNISSTDKDKEIDTLKIQNKSLAEELEKEKARNDAIAKSHETMMLRLMQEKMDLAIDAAGQKAKADQLQEQLSQQSRQIDSWVNAAFGSRMAHAYLECCDMSGSLID